MLGGLLDRAASDLARISWRNASLARYTAVYLERDRGGFQMSLRLTMHGVLLALASLIASTGLNRAGHSQELQWRDLDEIADLAKTQQRPVLWFRVLGDMKGYM